MSLINPSRRQLLTGLAGAPIGAAIGRAQPATRTFVLVHGAWHGGWCWKKLAPLLISAGYRVHAPTQARQRKRFRHIADHRSRIGEWLEQNWNFSSAQHEGVQVVLGVALLCRSHCWR